MTENRQAAELADMEVARILEGLRAEVRARRLGQGQVEESPLERDLQRSLDEIELHRVISAHWPLIGTTLPQRAIALINKLVRRYLRWYINPIVEQQNAYNDAVARALRVLAEAYADLGQQLVEKTTDPSDLRPFVYAQGSLRSGEPSFRAGGRWTIDDGRRMTNDQRPTTNDQSRMVDSDRPAIDEPGSIDDNTAYPTISHLPSPISHLQDAVRERALTEPPARFPDLELRTLEPHLGLRERVSAHWPLPAATLPQRAIALINKLVRRYLRWYINPIVEQQ
ncbi:MAG TPA: hypothetical protein VKE41_02500, partial [Roseiflexaceae bacterium]|nr:hypothetical protein [Roseiflexaceae bacterium]